MSLNDAAPLSQETPTVAREHRSADRKKRVRYWTADDRRAHRVFEKERRDAFRERLLRLAGLLPNLERSRPQNLSKHVVVGESIDHITTQNDRFNVALRHIRTLIQERDTLLKETNQWRGRLGMEPYHHNTEPEVFLQQMSLGQDRDESGHDADNVSVLWPSVRPGLQQEEDNDDIVFPGVVPVAFPLMTPDGGVSRETWRDSSVIHPVPGIVQDPTMQGLDLDVLVDSRGRQSDYPVLDVLESGPLQYQNMSVQSTGEQRPYNIDGLGIPGSLEHHMDNFAASSWSL